MHIIKPSAEIISATPNLEKTIELAGRTCYKSEDRITDDSAEAFIKRLIDSKHESVMEHGSISVKFVCDRGVSHELVRHRIASFSQESTRYCNYGKDKFGNELTFIAPGFWSPEDGATAHLYERWELACKYAEKTYLGMLADGASPQEARSVLPNSLKTEIVVTANPREWRWIFIKRCDQTAHPQMREIMVPLLETFKQAWPALFGDL